ncbi:complement C1q-like protein 2 [Oncorhynchus mykiss]|uniref:complement C1q-like protein 2 n=1 Tax=Oncorhynchus mykiss TaxID=8022 RepID=UPI0018777EBA|nr:complement C1q-like protein 2 [Oncorhynchus mykiss]
MRTFVALLFVLCSCLSELQVFQSSDIDKKLIFMETTGRTSESQLEEQRVLLQELRAIVAQQSTKLNEMGATVEELKRANGERPKVAFSASLSESKGPNSDDVILAYKHVFNNIGEAYSPVTGIFRAPVNGVYYFTYTAFTTSSKGRRVSLYKNGLVMVTVTDDVSDSEDGGTNGVTLQLDAGDEVYTRLMEGFNIYDDNNHHSTFTGFLLFT